MLEEIREIAKSERYADLTISCQGHVWNVHRLIVCPQVKFLEIAVRGGFKEATESHVDFPEGEPRTIAMLLSWCYNQIRDWNWFARTPADKARTLSDTGVFNLGPEDHFSLYMAADKYGVPELEGQSWKYLMDWTETHYQDTSFVDMVEQFWRKAPPHDRLLRNRMAQTMAQHYEEFRAHESGQAVLRDNQQLALEVLEQLANLYSELKAKEAERKNKYGYYSDDEY